MISREVDVHIEICIIESFKKTSLANYLSLFKIAVLKFKKDDFIQPE